MLLRYCLKYVPVCTAAPASRKIYIITYFLDSAASSISGCRELAPEEVRAKKQNAVESIGGGK